ncbi:MAG: hypothetical protein IBX68_06945 [Dehalococcoidia bacterium]|nr:hypothetical protein [Dehalococcoidia bacterium]
MLRILLSLAALALVSTVVVTSQVWAAAVGVTPGEMEFSLRPGGSQARTLHVLNPSDQALAFHVYVEGRNSEWFRVTPDEFSLGPQEVLNVEILVAAPLFSSGEHEVEVCVVSVPPDSTLRLGAGVKVSAHVRIEGAPLMAVQWWILLAVITAALLAGGVVLWRRRIPSQ